MKKTVSLLLLICILLSMAGCGGGSTGTEPTETTPPTTTEPEELYKNTMTGEELMNEMKIGWNLGNTFDAPDGEMSWGMPATTKEMIEKIHELGFNTLRMPISWHKHVGEAPDYIIDEAWLKRVEMIVNYALELDMYVIINAHHDNSIYYPAPDNAETGKTYLNAIWTQIAEYFKDYDHHLIFQAMNEPRVEGTSYEWAVDVKNEDCMAAVEVVNQLNQTAVDAIRATGGMNKERWIIVSPYVANAQAAVLTSFRLPEDEAGKLIVSVHAYSPYNLCLNVNSPESTYTDRMASEFTGFMKSVNRKFIQNGIPVIIDEMGCINKNNPDDRYAWAKAYVAAAKEYGMVCCWWDNGIVSSGEPFGILNRRKLEVFEESQTVLQGLMDGLAEQESAQ